MRSVIVDTSVWIEHLKKPDPVLTSLIENDRLLVHPAVAGELAVGHIRDRKRFLNDLFLFPVCRETPSLEVLRIIDAERLWGKGYSWVDCLIMASADVEDALIYSLEKRLNTFRPGA